MKGNNLPFEIAIPLRTLIESLKPIEKSALEEKQVNVEKKQAEIADFMCNLFIQMQKKNENQEYKYKTEDIFKELASAIGLEKKDPILYKMCVSVCKEIDIDGDKKENDKLTEKAYHNKQHFTEVMVNIFVLAKANGLDNNMIGKLLFTALIHDFKYKEAKELLELAKTDSKVFEENQKYLYKDENGVIKFKASGLEQYSCDKAEEYLLKNGFKKSQIKEQLEFSRAIIATTDIFSPESKELVEAIKEGGDKLKNFTFKNEFIQQTAEYFRTHPEAIKPMWILRKSDIISSSLLIDLSLEKNELVMLEFQDPKNPFTKLGFLLGHLRFLNNNAAAEFASDPFCSKLFEETINNTVMAIQKEIRLSEVGMKILLERENDYNKLKQYSLIRIEKEDYMAKKIWNIDFLNEKVRPFKQFKQSSLIKELIGEKATYNKQEGTTKKYKQEQNKIFQPSPCNKKRLPKGLFLSPIPEECCVKAQA